MSKARQAKPALHEGELQFHRLLEKLPAGAYTCDPEGLITYFNQHAVQLWGRAPKLYDPVDRFCGSFKLFSPDESPIAHDQCWMALALKMNKEFNGREIVIERPDGQRRTALAHANPIHDESGRLLGAVNVLVDISERKYAEQEIRMRHQQQAAIAELGIKALAENDLQVIMDEAVDLLCRTLDVDYCKVLELLPERDELLLRAGVGWKEGLVGSATVSASLGSQAGYTLLFSEPVIVEDLRTESRFSGPPLLHEHGVVSGMSVIIHGRDRPFGVFGSHTKSRRVFTEDDVNFLQSVANVLATAVERKRAEEALCEVREAERRRMARDLHDEALQDLTYALQAMRLTRARSKGVPELGTELEREIDALERATLGLRGAIYDLRLEGERERTFVEMLESLVKMNRQSLPGREIELSIEEGFASPLTRTKQVELLRIMQEALANVRRHSEARHVRVAVGTSGNKLWAEVEDDGRGFDPAEASAGMGAKGMRERARALWGDLQVRSEPGNGTKVRFELTLERDRKQAEEQVRILLVEDHASFRQAAASMFEREPDFTVVGQAGSLAEARTMLDGLDVAIVDLDLPDGYGGDLIKEIRGANPHAMALVLSAYFDRAKIARAVESGAAGVFHKSAGIDEVVEAVRRLRAGETLLPLEEVVELLRFASSRKEQEHEARQAIARLTPREKEVLNAVAEGLEGKEIAERLNISLRTERNHMASILAKLGVHSRLHALVFALRHGLVEIH